MGITGENFSNHQYAPPDDPEVILSPVEYHRGKQCGFMISANIVWITTDATIYVVSDKFIALLYLRPSSTTP